MKLKMTHENANLSVRPRPIWQRKHRWLGHVLRNKVLLWIEGRM